MKTGIAIFLTGIVITLIFGILIIITAQSEQPYYDWCASMNGQVVELYGPNICVSSDGRVILDGR